MTTESDHAKRDLKIIIDSNALFVPLQFNIDIFEDLKKILNRNFQFILLSPVLQELHRMSNHRSPKMRKNASYALKLVERCQLLDVHEDMTASVDDLIIQVAGKSKWPVFTNDGELRKRLRDINVPVIYVRQKSRLEIDGRL